MPVFDSSVAQFLDASSHPDVHPDWTLPALTSLGWQRSEKQLPLRTGPLQGSLYGAGTLVPVPAGTGKVRASPCSLYAALTRPYEPLPCPVEQACLLGSLK